MTASGCCAPECPSCGAGERLARRPIPAAGGDACADRWHDAENRAGAARPDDEAVIWVAWYSDFSDVAVFYDELEALRHAVAHHMELTACRPGSVREQLG